MNDTCAVCGTHTNVTDNFCQDCYDMLSDDIFDEDLDD